MTAKNYKLKGRDGQKTYEFSFDPVTQEFSGPDGEEVEALIQNAAEPGYIPIVGAPTIRWQIQEPGQITEAEVGEIMRSYAETGDAFPPLDWSGVEYDDIPGLVY